MYDVIRSLLNKIACAAQQSYNAKCFHAKTWICGYNLQSCWYYTQSRTSGELSSFTSLQLNSFKNSLSSATSDIVSAVFRSLQEFIASVKGLHSQHLYVVLLPCLLALHHRFASCCGCSPRCFSVIRQQHCWHSFLLSQTSRQRCNLPA